MSHAITVHDVLVGSGAALVVILVLGGIYALLVLFNPFRSGH
jgi:hypothetical protein